MKTQQRSRLIILDRDGVINQDSDAYIKSPAEWTPIPGSLEAIARLKAAGWTVAVATNQSGIARGLYDLETLERIHHKMQRAVEQTGGRIDLLEFCPHSPTDGCTCRKPAPGLYLRIAARLGVELQGVPVIGDSLRDLEAARAVGAAPILVLTGKGAKSRKQLQTADKIPVYRDLADAVEPLIGPLPVTVS